MWDGVGWMSGVFLYHSRLSFWDLCYSAWSSSFISLRASEPQVLPVSPSYLCIGDRGTCHHPWLFMWVMGVQTQIQATYPWSHLSSLDDWHLTAVTSFWFSSLFFGGLIEEFIPEPRLPIMILGFIYTFSYSKNLVWMKLCSFLAWLLWLGNLSLYPYCRVL